MKYKYITITSSRFFTQVSQTPVTLTLVYGHHYLIVVTVCQLIFYHN